MAEIAIVISGKQGIKKTRFAQFLARAINEIAPCRVLVDGVETVAVECTYPSDMLDGVSEVNIVTESERFL